jgi:site-specific DNA recombinase
MSRGNKIFQVVGEKSLKDHLGLIYTRVSSKKQETEGSGLQSQEERCIRELSALNVPHIRTFPDSYSGGGDFMNRPSMRELLAYIDSNPQKQYVVIFDDLSRLARDVVFHIKLRAEFRARDVILKCLNYNFDESEEGSFIEVVFASKAELDRKQNRRQVVQKMKARLDGGYWTFSTKKGYDYIKDSLHGNILIPNEEGFILKEALEAFAVGNLVRKIDVCRFLGERNFWKNQKKLAEARISHVTELMIDPFYCGDIEYPAWDVTRRKGHHEPLITTDTHERILSRLNKSESKRLRRDVSDDFPLRGLVLCEGCNKKMTGAWSTARNGKHAYYSCQTKECSYRRKSLRKKDIESNFVTVVKNNTLKSDVEPLVSLVFGRVWEQEIKSLKDIKQRHSVKMKTLEEDVRQYSQLAKGAKSEVVREGYEDQMEAIGKELAQLKSEPATHTFEESDIPYRTALNKALVMLKNPYEIWKDLSTVEKQRFFYFIFEDNLVYSRQEGYRTANSLSTTRLFEDFVSETSTMCSR